MKALVQKYVDAHRDVIDEIINLAGKYHDDTNQTYGEYPYSEHIKRVSNEAISRMYTQVKSESQLHIVVPIIFGAAFHDSIEDARLTYNDVFKIARKFFDESSATMATEIVYAVTNEKGRNRNERANDSYYEGIRATPYAPFVKYCDRMANYKFSEEQGSRMHKLYEKEMPEFLKKIGMSDE